MLEHFAYVALLVGALTAIWLLTRRSWDKSVRLPPRTTTALEPRTTSKAGWLP